MPGPWPDTAAFGPEGLTVGGTRASALADRYGTPLVVVDEDHFRNRCRIFGSVVDRALWAVKAFPAQALIRIAADEGLGLLAATSGEADACLRAGVPSSRVVLHGSNKLDGELELAVEEGLGLVIVDNAEEAERLDEIAGAHDRSVPVLLRIAPGIEVTSHEYVVTGAPDTKFGVPVAEGMALGALKRVLDCPRLDLQGVHVHVGSQLLDHRPYLAAVEVALDFLAEAREATGFEARLLDTGGGMGTTYTDETPPDPAALADRVREAVEEGCRQREVPVPRLVWEPGRAVSSAAAVTLYRVGTVKDVPGIRTFASVDGGMSDNIRPALYDARYTVALAARRSAAAAAPVTVVGRHCESGDVLARDVSLPGDLGRGDLVAFAGTGAYEYAMASTYNKVGRPAVVLVRGGETRPILRREDEADLARLDLGPGGIDVVSPPPGVEIRPARPGDGSGAHRLLRDVAAEGRYIRTERLEAARRDFRRRFKDSWTDERAEIVALRGGEVIGHLAISREPGTAIRHVATLGMSVRKEERGGGVGSALLAEALRWARWTGVEKISLSVFPHNRAAMALYRKFGFVQEGRLVGHTRKSYGLEDEIVMARPVETEGA